MSKSQQNYLDQVAQRLHLTADAQSGILFGMQGGLHMMLMRSTSKPMPSRPPSANATRDRPTVQRSASSSWVAIIQLLNSTMVSAPVSGGQK